MIQFNVMIPTNDGGSEERWYEVDIVTPPRLHRIDGPAVITRNTHDIIISRKWYQHGFLHRDNDEPAIINNNELLIITKKIWFRYGLIHRDDDKPAFVILNDGTLNVEWYNYGDKYQQLVTDTCIV